MRDGYSEGLTIKIRTSSQVKEFGVELVEPHNHDTVKLMVTALGNASSCRIERVLDLVDDVSEMTRRCLIESRLDQDTVCIGGKIMQNR